MCGDILLAAMEMAGDLVAMWEVHLSDGIHVVEFEHGTTSGRRVVRKGGGESRVEHERSTWINF